jgi:hypothetical protein
VKMSVFAELADEGAQVHIEGVSDLRSYFEGGLPLSREDHGDSRHTDIRVQRYCGQADKLAAEQHTLGSGVVVYAALWLVIFTFCIFSGHIVRIAFSHQSTGS